jgi:type I restriction enzyme S subunit
MRSTYLGTVCDIDMGQAPNGSSYNDIGEGYPLLAGASDFGVDSPIPSKFTTEPTKLSKPGDLLLCIRATIGDLNWSDQQYCLGRGVAGLRPKNKELDRRYLWRWLSFVRPALEKRARGSTFKQVSRQDISDLEILLPNSIDEQRRIATVLDKADAIRRKREKLLAMADELLKSLFLEMFGDPFSNPMVWPIASLGELGEVQGGLQVTPTRDALALQLPYLRVANVYRDRLDLSEIKQIGLTAAEFERAKLEVGGVLIVEGHGNPEEIGRAAVWDGSIDPCVHQNHLIRFRADRSQVSPLYVGCFLNSAGGRLQLIGAGRTTSGLNTISTRKVKEVRIPVPALALQKKFDKFVSRKDCCCAHFAMTLDYRTTYLCRFLNAPFAANCEVLQCV